MIVDNIHASATGDIAEFRAGSSPKLSVDRGGGLIFDGSSAAVAANYEIRRNADATNLQQYNVPTGASHEFSVNDVTAALLSATNLTLTANIAFAAAATYDIGTTTVGVNDIHLGLAGVINFDGGDVTMTHAANTLTFAGATTGYVFNDGVVNASSASIRVKRSVADITVPPTDAELDATFGDPTVVGSGFVAMVDDNDLGTSCYLVWTTGTAAEWFYALGTKAT